MTFLGFKAFFPQLEAGPNERAPHLLPQIQARRAFSYPNAVLGCRLMLIGAFKKMVVADRAAPHAEAIFENQLDLAGLFNVIGAIFFAIQIYCDFSGYSDIAVGVGKLFNLNLMANFNRPYFIRSLRGFWSRWHISLGTWFRDHVYIPLGGNRGTVGCHAFNLMLTFVLSGLWHGANWTIFCWGALHGGFLILERFIGKPMARTPPFFQWSITMLVVLIGWVFFRAEELTHAVECLGNTTNAGPGLGHQLNRLTRLTGISKFSLLCTALFAGLVLVMDKLSISTWFIRALDLHRALRYSAYATLVAFVLLFGVFTDQSAFIYFQF